MGSPSDGMQYRPLGQTGIQVSELGFGAWGIGGRSYGRVEKVEALNALARAEELGCNLVDTAAVYGDSEAILGEFLQGRRDRWLVATKYSGQQEGITATLDSQLRRLRTPWVDIYQLHWVPRGGDEPLLEELIEVKGAGKARYVGVSAYSIGDVDAVLKHGGFDSVMLPFSLLDPFPFLARADRLRASGIAVLARSVLKEGFLAGNFDMDTVFADPDDQRHRLTRQQIAETIERVERFRFLEREAGSMAMAAISYPLSFPEISSVILGTRSVGNAEASLGEARGRRLSDEALQNVRRIQAQMRLGTWRERWSLAFQRMFGR